MFNSPDLDLPILTPVQDVEVNRPGEKGFRKKTPKPKKTKDAEVRIRQLSVASPNQPATTASAPTNVR